MQVAPPREIYRRPGSLFVADFIGSPTINLIPGRIVRKNEGIFFEGALSLPAPGLAAHAGAEVTAAIRPEEIRIETGESGDAVPGEVYAVLPAGVETIVQVRREGRIFNIRVMGRLPSTSGERVCMQFIPEAVIFSMGRKATASIPAGMNMDAIRLENFRDAMKAAAVSLVDAPCREITLIHHNDTDGITAGAILKKSLMRAGFAAENIPIERVHPAFLPAIHTPERRLILYADLGGQVADVISRHIPEGCRVIILITTCPPSVSFPVSTRSIRNASALTGTGMRGSRGSLFLRPGPGRRK